MSRSGPRPTPRNQFSFSRVKAFFQCPARYRFRYLKGMKDAFRSIESHLGSAVHDVLEWLYAERLEGREPDRTAAVERFTHAWRRGWTDEVTVVRVDDRPDDLEALGRDMVARFVDGAFARDRSETVALERRLHLRLEGGLVFTGFADRVGRTENGRLFVVDYKTSKSLGDGSDFSEGLQAPLYAACALVDETGDEALAGYHYLRHETTRWQPIDGDAATRVVGRFTRLATTADQATDFPTRPGPLCAWCGFNHVCPDAQVPDHVAGGRDLAVARSLPRALGDDGRVDPTISD
jgi:putative RecB family exonuclease